MTTLMRTLGSFLLVAAFVSSFGCLSAQAAPRTWIGGNVDWVDNAGNTNWTPVPDEPDPDDEAIFNTPNTLSLGSDNSIQALTMSAGISLSTANNDLTVDGLIQLVDSSTDLIIGDAMSVVSADRVTINNLGEVRLSGGTLNVIEETGNGLLDINADGLLSGSGTVNLQDQLPGVTALIINDGTISASFPSLIITGAPPPAGTLTINVSDVTDGRVDLDGTGGNGVVNVFRNQTLDINGTLSDAFSGDINLFHNSTLDISAGWGLDSGTIDVDNGFAPGFPPITPDTPADTSFISGGNFEQSGGTITVADNDGTLQFNAAYTQTGGTLTNNGLVVFNANATIGAGAAFNMPTATSSITVNAGVTVNVDQANFNTDGNATATNVITINSGGVLDFDLGAGADEGFGGAIVLNGGELDVTTADDNWSIDRTVNVGADTGMSDINGELVSIASATITVGANSTLDINADAIWGATGNLVTNAGAVTRLDGTTTFSGDGSFTGDGGLRTGGDTNFAAVTTINMPGGSVDLDGGDVLVNTVTVNANTTITAGTMASFGGLGMFPSGTLVLNNFASLTVNLTDPNAEWTLTPNGVLDINAVGGMLGGSGIQGSDFNMAGTATISGNSIWTARTDISGTATVAALGSLNLRGGDLTNDNVNRLENGTITDPGMLRALTDEGLFGFGTIDTEIDFATNTELRADNGILTVNGVIIDLGVFGTADVDGILNRPAAWNSATNINFVNMRGGEIRGGTITNDNTNGITGFGLISARVINNTSLTGENGGNLVVETALNNNNWDGAANTGQIRANTGDVELRDDTFFPFSGTVVVRPGRTVFANGFELRFQPASTLNLSSGTYRSSEVTNFAGTMTVLAGADSTLTNEISQRFENGSTTTLTGNLLLDSPFTTVQAGADFTGPGSLINLPTRVLRLLDGILSSELGVLIENRGVVHLGAAGQTGQVAAVDYQQAAGGELEVEFAGTGLAQFDRLNLTGAASLAGTLDLGLLNMFVPDVGNVFNILSASGGVTGTFGTVNQPAALLAAGRMFNVVYSPTLVQLVVAGILAGDYNRNGVVDAADYAQWRDTLGSMVTTFNGADGDGDGTVDNDDYDVWRANFGAVAGSGTSAATSLSGSASVPEPQSMLLLLLAALMPTATPRRSRCHAGRSS